MILGLLAMGMAARTLAVALGEITVGSALNERLLAQVPLRGLAVGELENLKVELAPDEAFRRAGLERGYLLTRLKFKAVARGERTGSVRITSKDHIREPSLSFILQVTSKGRVVQRRYDVLLNLR